MHSVLVRSTIPALTGLRGIAAVWVLAFHAWLLTRGLPGDGLWLVSLVGRAGYLGVDLFFVLSGFVIALNYAEERLHRSATGYVRFLTNRFARIWPVHLVTSVLLGLAILTSLAIEAPLAHMPPISEFFISLTMMHAWAVPVPKIWNTVSWSISAEWAAYLCFPLVAGAVLRLRTNTILVAILLGLFVGLGIFIESVSYRGTMAYGMHRVAAEFTAGVLLFRLWQLTGRGSSTAWGAAAGFALATLILGGGLTEAVLGFAKALPVFPILAAVVVFGIVAGDGPLVRGLSVAPLQYLGRISYSLYLAHGPIMRLANAILAEYGLRGEPRAVSIIVISASFISLLLAHWLYHSIEEPARRMIRRIDFADSFQATAKPLGRLRDAKASSSASQ